MTASAIAPVLILGGYGSLGSRIARMLRRLHPRLPITIAGRNLEKAETLALDIGAADAVAVDLSKADLGLPVSHEYSVVVTAVRDTSLNTMRYAQQAYIPYLALSDAPFEIGPLVARFMHNPGRNAVLLLGHGIGGVPTLAALHFAKDFESIDQIDIGLIFDPGDPFGPMSAVDMEHITKDGPPPLILKQGVWRWGDPEHVGRPITGAGGTQHLGQAVGLLDVLSLASVMPRGSIRVDAAQGLTRSSRTGGRPSHEVVIEITGRKNSGRLERYRYELIDADGYAALSARGISVAVEKMLGLSGSTPPPAGLYFPESLIDTGHFMDRLESFGVVIAQGSACLSRTA